jgi:hypothetical protein
MAHPFQQRVTKSLTNVSVTLVSIARPFIIKALLPNSIFVANTRKWMTNRKAFD